MRAEPAQLEQWYRDVLPARFDLSSSGVHPFSFGEVIEIAGIDEEALRRLSLDDTTSLGSPNIREVVASTVGTSEPNKVLIANGSSEALFLVLATMLQPGDEVIVTDPIYHGLVAGVAMNGCRVVRWPLRREGGFAADLDLLASLLTPKTRAVIANFPHNPTGVTLSPGGLRTLVDLVARQGTYLAWDAAFELLVYDGNPLPNPATLYERAIAFGTLSKAYGLPGLRFGWCIGPEAVIDGTIGLRDRSTLFVSALVEFVAAAVLGAGPRFVERRLETARENRAIVHDWIQSEGDTIAWSLPSGGVCGFPELHGIDVARFCRDLAERADTILVPGEAFDHAGHVRLGFGGRRTTLVEGLARLSAAFRDG
jgi:capreomycidine synthase